MMNSMTCVAIRHESGEAFLSVSAPDYTAGGQQSARVVLTMELGQTWLEFSLARETATALAGALTACTQIAERNERVWSLDADDDSVTWRSDK